MVRGGLEYTEARANLYSATVTAVPAGTIRVGTANIGTTLISIYRIPNGDVNTWLTYRGTDHTALVQGRVSLTNDRHESEWKITAHVDNPNAQQMMTNMRADITLLYDLKRELETALNGYVIAGSTVFFTPGNVPLLANVPNDPGLFVILEAEIVERHR